ncbi:hypothetical protein CEXT_237541 [Caerostris extrusa]|uniref:Uncharacterized protein n=1 Tax=Caerostris extrusa TaxID=172846 RepID=A0AAV4Y6K7_CAEEX|nr:hypothetical protein CEXT_237541 [Caerostris extrusa]
MIHQYVLNPERASFLFPCRPDRQSKPVFKKCAQVKKPIWDRNLDSQHVEDEFVRIGKLGRLDRGSTILMERVLSSESGD